MTIDWSWTARVGTDHGFTVHSSNALVALAYGALIGSGADPAVAHSAAREVLQEAWAQQEKRLKNWSVRPWTWSLDLPGGALTITSNDLPEDPAKACDGRTGEGRRCPRRLNHLGTC